MKISITGILTLLAGASVALGQGAISLANYGFLNNYIYVSYRPVSGPTVLLGGSPIGPAPTLTNYAEEVNNGREWTLQLYGAVGANLPSTSLLPLPGMTATFAAGVDLDDEPGTWVSTAVATFSNAPAATMATVQLYVWYNDGGTITNLDQALTNNVPVGVSSLANVTLEVPPATLPAALGGFGVEYFPGPAPYHPTIIWTNPAPPLMYGAALGTNQLDAVAASMDAAVQGEYVYNPTLGIVLTAGTHTLSVVFYPVVVYDYRSATASTTIVVSPAPLTITASNEIWVVGQPFPSLTGSITGVTNGDNITAAYSCSATTNSPAGTYPIVPSLVDPGDLGTNYTVTLVNGTLTIVAPPTLLATLLANNRLRLTWISTVGDMYQLQFNSDLSVSNWTNQGSAMTATGTALSATISTTNATQRFYRLMVLP